MADHVTSNNPRLASPKWQLQPELTLLDGYFNSTSSSNHASVEVLEEAFGACHRIRCLVLDAPVDARIKDDFRRSGGFETLLNIINCLPGTYADQSAQTTVTAVVLRVLKESLEILTNVLKEHSANRQYFTSRVEDGGWAVLEQALLRFVMCATCNEISCQERQYFFGLFFAFATADETMTDAFRHLCEESNPESDSSLVESQTTTVISSETVWHPEMLHIILSLLRQPLIVGRDNEQTMRNLTLSVVNVLSRLSQSSCYNAARIQSTNLQHDLLRLLKEDLPAQEDCALRALLLTTMRLGIERLDALDQFCLAACGSARDSQLFLQSLRLSREPSSFHFDLSMYGYASLEFADLKGDFPPRDNGYSLQMWIKVDEFDDSCHTTLFGTLTPDQSCFLLLYIERGTRQLVLQTSVSGSKPSVRFKSMTFSSNTWYHLALIHKTPTNKSSSHATLFVDGILREQISCCYPGPSRSGEQPRKNVVGTGSQVRNAPTQAFIGTPQDLSPRLGRGILKSRISIASFHLFSTILPDDLVYVYYMLGPSYSGNFQDCLGSFQTYAGSAKLNERNELQHSLSGETSLITQAVRGRLGKINAEINIVLGVSPVGAIGEDIRTNKGLRATTSRWPRATLRALKSYLRHSTIGIVLNTAVPDVEKALQRRNGVGVLTGGSTWYITHGIDEAVGRLTGCITMAIRLVKLAVTEDAILRAVTTFFELISQSWRNSEAAERENGFGVLALLLEDKLLDGSCDNGDTYEIPSKTWECKLSVKVLGLILRFLGYDEANPDDAILQNPLGYSKLIIETDVWRRSNQETQKLYYKQFEIFAAAGKTHSTFNLKRLKQMRVAKKLIDSLDEGLLDEETLPFAFHALQTLTERTISADVYRSIALFIVYSLHRGPVTTNQAIVKESKSEDVKDVEADAFLSDNHKRGPRSTVQASELGIALLEMFVNMFCRGPIGAVHVNKFAKSVSNKWLLHLFVESDKRVIIAALQILSSLALNTSYMSKFEVKAEGFLVLRARLAKWWHVEEVWTICLGLFLRLDVARMGDSKSLNLEELIELYSLNPGTFYSPIFAVLLDMMEAGLKSCAAYQIPVDSTDAHEPHQSPECNSTSSIVHLESVVEFFVKLITQHKSFREFAAELNLTKDLLQILSSVIGSSSASTKSNQQENSINNKPVVGLSRRRGDSSFSISSGFLNSPATTRLAMPWRRGSSFVVVSQNDVKKLRASLIQQPLLSQHGYSYTSMSLLVRRITFLLTYILSSQTLYTKDFGGYGLFLKAPPGSDADRNKLVSQVIRATLKRLIEDLGNDPILFTETKCLANLSRLTRQLGEAVFEGWAMTEAHSLLSFIAICIRYLQSAQLSSIKNVRLCRPMIADMQHVFRRVALLSLSSTLEHTTVSQETLMSDLQDWWYVWGDEEGDLPMLAPLCYILFEKLTSGCDLLIMAASQLWRLVLAHGSEEVATALTDNSDDYARSVLVDLTSAVHTDLAELSGWIHVYQRTLKEIFDQYPKTAFLRFVAEENSHNESSAATRVAKRNERLKDWQTNEDIFQRVRSDADTSAEQWISNICASEQLKFQRLEQDIQDTHDSLEASLSIIVARFEATTFTNTCNSKMQLDEVEGRDRMRLRMVPADELGEVVYKPKRQKSTSVSTFTGTVGPEVVTNTSTRKGLTNKQRDQKEDKRPGPSQLISEQATTTLGDDFEVISGALPEHDFRDDKNRRVLRSLQRGEQVRNVHNIALIKGLEPLEGLLIVGKQCVYLVGDLFQRLDGEIVSSRHAPPEERDPYLQLISGNTIDVQKNRGSPYSVAQHTRHWRWPEMISVSKRRFLLRDVALEIFFNDGLSYLLTAATVGKRDNLYLELLARAPHIKYPPSPSDQEDAWRIALLPNPRDETGVRSKLSNVFGSPSSIPGTDQWLKGEISNFHYLMLVNTVAGRTFNDLTQYPIFPWVIADYRSEELNLSDPRSFRDLTKPMGCQNPGRESAFRERYRTFAEMTDHQEPAFHYGTHYSTAMIVTSYLIRLQPFVQSYLLLQGGTFDHADRLFSSIETAWLSASRDNMTDVRELTPEFFYLPEFLINSNKYDFGFTQTGAKVVNNVHLPPWAKDDPGIFIAKHREALESPFVTRNLHSWINLVFGHSQRGEAAVDAVNVFHHLSYQGARDLDKIEDHRERLATIGIIHNFGQTPRQIFTRPHEPRLAVPLEGLCSDQVLKSLVVSRSPLFETNAQVSTLAYSRKKLGLIHTDPFKSYVPPNNSSYIRWCYSDRSLRLVDGETNKVLAIFEQLHTDIIVSAQFIDSKRLLTASRDCTIAIWVVEQESGNFDLQLKTTLVGHRQPILSMALSRSLRTLVSVSEGGEVIIWDINRFEILRKLSVRGSVVAVRISDLTGNIVLCTANTMFVFALNGRLLAERHTHDTDDQPVASCAIYQGSHGEWVPGTIIFTGHARGFVKIWSLEASATGKWGLTNVHTLQHLDRKLGDGTMSASTITCILPLKREVFTGDEDGRVFQWKSRLA